MLKIVYEAVLNQWYLSIIIYRNHSVQSLSHVWLCVIPWTAACQASLSITKAQGLLKLMSIELVMQSSFSQHQGFFQWVSSIHRGPKHWNFSFTIGLFNGYSGLISFRIDWFDLLAVQGTLKHLLQHHSSKASILRLSAFFIVQLSHPYMTTGKIIALTRRTFVGKVMSLLLNMLSKLVIVFLPRSKHLLMAALTISVILEPKKIKSVTVSIVSPSICHEVMGLRSLQMVTATMKLKDTYSLEEKLWPT